MTDMISVYAQERFNERAAARQYANLYPNRRQPDRKLFSRLFARLREYGTFKKKTQHGRPVNRTVEQEEQILNLIEDDPTISIRRISGDVRLGRNTVLKILHEQQLRPFHYTPVQNLLPGDLLKRRNFCEFIIRKNAEDEFFTNKILFTDEATFTRRGVFNRKNCHIWADENPNGINVHHFQHEFKLNIWFGIIGDYLLGPCELPQTLNGQQYLYFLQNNLVNLLEDIPLDIRAHIWYLQDGAPAHYPLIVRSHLNTVFPHKWIGRGSEHPWPPRSPDLNPLDFFFWGYIKSMVYTAASINTREELWQRIVAAADAIRNLHPSFFAVRRNFLKRCRTCVNVNGGHFENILKSY